MRTATVTRKTKETDITLTLCLDGGEIVVETGIGFFNHMLTALALHAGFGMTLKAIGDLQVDGHHTVEDTGLVLGDALAQVLGDRAGIIRFGSAWVPMDEAMGYTVLDCSGRPFHVFDAPMPQERCGEYDTCLTAEFMRALATRAGLTLHQGAPYGQNAHHITEALYKSLALALRQAVAPRAGGVASTKGVL